MGPLDLGCALVACRDVRWHGVGHGMRTWIGAEDACFLVLGTGSKGAVVLAGTGARMANSFADLD